jgi:hypothetical protein
MPRTACLVCGSTDLTEVKMTRGPHYARMTCPAGHFVDWVARPPMDDAQIPEEIRGLIVQRKQSASLQGSPSQVALARGIRMNMISFANQAGASVEYVRLLTCINDATWFLANKGKFPPTLKCWPRVDQMAQVEETATR